MLNFPNWMSQPDWWSAIGTILASFTAIVIASWNWLKIRFERKSKLNVENINYQIYSGGTTRASIFTIKIKNIGSLIATNCLVDFVIVNDQSEEREADSTNVDKRLGHIAPNAIVFHKIESVRLDPEPSYTVWILFQVNGISQKPTKHTLSYPRNIHID